VTQISELKTPEHLPTQAIVGRLLREHVRGFALQICVAGVLMGVVAATTAAYAYLVQPVLDDIFVNRDENSLVGITIAMLVVFALKGLADYGQTVIMAKVSMRIVADIRQRVFDNLVRADLAFFHDKSTGELLAGIMNNVDMLRDTVSKTLTAIAKDSLTLAFLVALMFYQDWLLALISFFVFPLAVLPTVLIGRKVRRRASRAWAELEQVTALMSESFRGIRHIKAYGQEEREKLRARAKIDELFLRIFKTMRAKAVLSPIMEVLGGVAVAIILLYGGTQVIAGATTTGAFFSFLTALLLAYQPMKDLAKLNNNLQEGLAAAQRVFTLIDVEPQIRDREGAIELHPTAGHVTFEDVHFAYGDAPALHGITIEAPAGKTVALVGASGAGKSTILNLIPRFYDVSSGRVAIDGHDVRDVTLASLRHCIALVSQEVALFNDTVRANIAFGRPEASDAEIERAAGDAAAHNFIMALPQGYDTPVGESGVKLSGGQRQRLSIARAILRDAPILLLDEATSALDSQSEREVQEALNRLAKGRTTLVVAHRLSTIADADNIYVLDHGKVVEAGTHGELLARRGIYAGMYALQVIEDPDAASILAGE